MRMKTLLKKIRSIYIINLIFRNLVLLIKPFHSLLFKKLTNHMPVQGIVKLKLHNGKALKMYSNSDDFMLKEVFFGITDESGTDRLVSILAPLSDVIVDVGANTGLFSLFCFGYNNKAKIHAFEPVKTIGNRFNLNRQLNNADTITLHRTVLSDQSTDERLLYVPNSDISYSSSILKEFHDEDSVKKLYVKSETLDGFVKENNIDRVDLVKIDVEWHEYEVLKGSLNVLDKFSPVLIIEVLFAEVEELKNSTLVNKLPKDHHIKISEFLRNNGYNFYEINHNSIKRVDELMPGKHERNYLFSKKRSVDQRLYFADQQHLIKQIV